ncbi:ABC transporter permease [Nocardiopsis changdeensis]|uniref:ABC transporter permease n=1 Tax=Nocardiopsis changdeensis TaxID=2831969 RepID=A0ABX8BRV6_9ACTN|nr:MULTISPECIES: FtsX-like permease family protein [Nocardiopsis]QUX24856.1 ABC transporter permease [Nocardiopsis changdeensis]QYX35242.1 ABC transporter permease [Nocardiopsis sp. MT53]
MLRTTLAGLRLHKSRYVTTVLAIMLGVMFTTGTMVFADTLEAGYEKTVMGSATSVDAIAVPAEGGEEEPAPLAEEALTEIRALPQVAGADGLAEGQVVLLDSEGRASGFVPPAAVSFGEHTRFSAEEGDLPAGGDEIALAVSTAEQLGFGVGDTVTVLDPDQEKREFTLTGLVEFGADPRYSYSGVVVFDHATLGGMTAAEGYVEIDAVAAEGYTDRQVADAVAGVLGADAEVLTGEEFGVALAEESGADTAMLRVVLLLFSFIAMFVAGIVIYNTFAILIAQRQRELALLRCVGAKRSQVFRSMLAESLIVGLVASALGVLAGIGIGMAGATFGGPLLGMDGAALTVTPLAVATGMVLGTVVTVFSALVPATRATRVAPLAALRTSATAAGLEKGTGWVRVVLGLLAFAASAALVAVSQLAGPNQLGPVIVTGSALIAFLGVVVLGPLLVRGIVNVVGLPLRRVGVPSMLAVDNSVRNPRRAATAMIALTVGATLITGYSVVSASTETTLTKMLDEQFPVDYQIMAQMGTEAVPAAEDAPAEGTGEEAAPAEGAAAEGAPAEGAPAEGAAEEQPGTDPAAAAADSEVEGLALPLDPGIPAEVRDTLGEQDELERVIADRNVYVELGGDQSMPVTTYINGRIGVDLTADTVEGDLTDLGPGRVVVSEGYADGARVGDTFTVPGLWGADDLELDIVAITENGGGLTGATVDPEDFAAAYPEVREDRTLYVVADADTEADRVRDAVLSSVEDHPTLQVMSVAEMKEQFTGILDIAFYTVAAMLGLAIIIAVFGIANTMALSVLERTRESALLRALGLTKAQLRRMLSVEAVLLCLIGAGIGIVFGVLFGWAAADSVLPNMVFAVPSGQIAVFIAVSVLAGLIAAVLPARRAAGTSITGALASE